MSVNPFHNRMFFTSFSFLFMSVIAWYHDYEYLALIDLGLFITSVNYWHRPLKNWRRWIDMAWVFITVISHMFSFEEHIWSYISLILLINGLYLTCKISDNRNLNAYCHSIMHIIVVYLFTTVYELHS